MATEKLLIDLWGVNMNEVDTSDCTDVEDILSAVITYLSEQPTVDAVEVVHGEWEIIEDDYFDLVELKCSACGESYGFESYEDCIPRNYHYCPNCGAKMDGERKDNG